MDAAFPTRPFPGMARHELKAAIANPATPADRRAKMQAEVDRQEAVLAGDTSLMTPTERLRHIRAGGTL